MRTSAPDAFAAVLQGPDGSYTLRFSPDQDGDGGRLLATVNGKSFFWPVNVVERSPEGELTLSGMAAMKEEWGDGFWFELRIEPGPPSITYWGDRVIWRTDQGSFLL
jgi:hypothetical protein